MLGGFVVTASAALTLRAGFGLTDSYLYKASGVFVVGMLIALGFLRDYHPFVRFGPANQVTMLRAALVALVAAFVGEPGLGLVATGAASLGLMAAALDGVDGWLARRTRLASAFGARFDMEVDTLLILMLSVLLWRYEKTGAWVLCSALLRYFFVAAGREWEWLQRPLPPSRRRQAGCVIQTVALGIALLPLVEPRFAAILAAIALLLLSASFAIDIVWLWRHADERSSRGQLGRWAALAASVILLNASLTFHNVWPTPAIYWKGELSIELAVSLLALALAQRWLGSPSRRLVRWLAVVWLVLVVGRYADVTSLALYGREVNLYWDLRYIPDVAAMLARAAPLWMAAVAGAALVLLAMYWLLRWALGRVSIAMGSPLERGVLASLSIVAIALFAAEQPGSPNEYKEYRFAPPVSQTYARQVRLAMHSLAGSNSLAPSPPMDSDLSLIRGADVFLMFVESYGAVTYDRPEFARELALPRAQLEAAIHESGREVVSAFVESPTFGGASWLAHISLMSGIEVRDPDTNAALMTEKRNTVVSAFRHKGYRTVALMPGLWSRWPEGEFYEFDETLQRPPARLRRTGSRLVDHVGPVRACQARRGRSETRNPARHCSSSFRPSAPTLRSRLLHPTSPTGVACSKTSLYDDPDVLRIYSESPDWLNLGPSYMSAVAYVHASIGGYLRMRADRDFVLVIIGDHQPPAAVSGEGASWDVPVHIVASRKPVIDRLLRHGFRQGLAPDRPHLGRMHELLPILLEAFGESASSDTVTVR